MDLKSDPRIVMTLDAGGTNFRFSAIRGGEPATETIAMPSDGDNLDQCLTNIVDGFARIRDLCPELPAAISFAFPGPADYPRGIIGDLGNLPGFRGGIALGPMLEDRFSVPAFINNDGDLFVYGEAISGFLPYINGQLEKAGSPKRYKNLFGVTLGTGFGGGIVKAQNTVVDGIRHPEPPARVEGQAPRITHPALGGRQSIGNKVRLTQYAIGALAIGFEGGIVKAQDAVVEGIRHPQAPPSISKRNHRQGQPTLGGSSAMVSEIKLTQHGIGVGAIGFGGGIIEAQDAVVEGIGDPQPALRVDRYAHWSEQAVGSCRSAAVGEAAEEVGLTEHALGCQTVAEHTQRGKAEHALVELVGHKNFAGGGINRNGSGRPHP